MLRFYSSLILEKQTSLHQEAAPAGADGHTAAPWLGGQRSRTVCDESSCRSIRGTPARFQSGPRSRADARSRARKRLRLLNAPQLPLPGASRLGRAAGGGGATAWVVKPPGHLGCKGGGHDGRPEDRVWPPAPRKAVTRTRLPAALGGASLVTRMNPHQRLLDARD